MSQLSINSRQLSGHIYAFILLFVVFIIPIAANACLYGSPLTLKYSGKVKNILEKKERKEMLTLDERASHDEFGNDRMQAKQAFLSTLPACDNRWMVVSFISGFLEGSCAVSRCNGESLANAPYEENGYRYKSSPEERKAAGELIEQLKSKWAERDKQ